MNPTTNFFSPFINKQHLPPGRLFVLVGDADAVTCFRKLMYLRSLLVDADPARLPATTQLLKGLINIHYRRLGELMFQDQQWTSKGPDSGRP